MSEKLEKLKGLLSELFQLDQADLDFGIYRIMNQKRDEVVRFLDKDLLPQVQEAFKQYKSADKAVLQAELDKLVASVQGAGMNPDESPKVKELRQRIADSAVDVAALENEVFSHLFSFFRRYYSEGDFLSLRRYKEGVYAIPYEGEEVKLHWANADQYYVKSSEAFKDYTFRIESGKRVRVHLVAATTEQDNNKPAPGKERRFVLCSDQPLREENGELFIRFEYRLTDGNAKQDELNTQAIDAILKTPGFDRWVHDLGKLAPSNTDPNRTLLEKHLSQYTKKNTFDYFIHKDLGSFLRRELDFYIKNEVMHLDDIEHESSPKVEQFLSEIKVIRSIAQKIIQFLEQLENFQKKLWLKKKFVIETNYCITLDRVPEELYPEIAKSNAQREEWVRLFAINEITSDLVAHGYSEPLSVEFLKENPKLPVDTAFHSAQVTTQILSSLDSLDDQLDGLLIQADNHHALDLVGRRYQHRVKCIYIDPPYNTGKDDFLYKDNYQSSSWLSAITDRAVLAKRLLADDGVFVVSISDHEVDRLRLSLHEVFGRHNMLAHFVWHNEGNIDNQSKVKLTHEYILAYCVDERAYPHARVIAPDIGEDSKLYNETIENSITKNGPGNPPSEITLPVGFPAAFEEGEVPARSDQWPHLRDAARVKNSMLVNSARAYSGWSSRDLIDAYIENNCQPIRDAKGLVTWFKLTHTGAIYCYKTRDNQSHVLSIIRNVGTVKKTSAQLERMGFRFAYPKPVALVEYLLKFVNDEDAFVADYYAGSGTTAHAALNLKRAAGPRRRFLIVDNGAHFDRIIRPRVLRVAYSAEWADVKPLSRTDGLSLFVKYIRLESYEDSLNNLRLTRTEQQKTLLAADAEAREQYILSYMLDTESRASPSLLSVEAFRKPDEYKLRVERNGEFQLVNVELVETFNWLLGLIVKHIDVIRGVRVVEGKDLAGNRVLVLWRDVDKMDNDALDKWFEKQAYNTREMEYDLFYVNGDNNLENLRRVDQTWKVRLIEEEFKRLMFDVEDV